MHAHIYTPIDIHPNRHTLIEFKVNSILSFKKIFISAVKRKWNCFKVYLRAWKLHPLYGTRKWLLELAYSSAPHTWKDSVGGGCWDDAHTGEPREMSFSSSSLPFPTLCRSRARHMSRKAHWECYMYNYDFFYFSRGNIS